MYAISLTDEQSTPADPRSACNGYLYGFAAGEERRRAEIQLAGERRLLEMLASGRALAEILGALCSFVEDACAECYCGVYLVDWGRAKLHTVAAPSLPLTFREGIEGLPV